MIFAAQRERRRSIRKTAAWWPVRGDKVLNQRTESKRDSRVAFSTTGKNNFTIRLRLKVLPDRFQSAARRYADK
jgi:hypothetical protein